MSHKLRNLILGTYLLSIIILLVAAGATRGDVVDIHYHDTYFVMDGFVVFMSFAVLLSLILPIFLLAQRLLRYPLLTAIHAFGTVLLVGISIAIIASGGAFNSGVPGPHLINLSEQGSAIRTLLNITLYWQLLLPSNVLLRIATKSPKPTPQ